jgi:hypothetical protein
MSIAFLNRVDNENHQAALRLGISPFLTARGLPEYFRRALK